MITRTATSASTSRSITRNAAVRAYFGDALLEVCWERGDDWGVLCPFLDLPTPGAPFPHANQGSLKTDRPDWRARNLANMPVSLGNGHKS
jgi:hypothetical protein